MLKYQRKETPSGAEREDVAERVETAHVEAPRPVVGDEVADTVVRSAALDMENGQLALICKALGHPARLGILELLQQEDGCTVGEIVDVTPLAQSTVSQHLKLLKDAGLIRGESHGPSTRYSVSDETLSVFKARVAFL